MNFLNNFRTASLAALAVGGTLGAVGKASAADVACNVSCPRVLDLRIELFRVGDARPTQTIHAMVYWFQTFKFRNVPTGNWFVRVSAYASGSAQGQAGHVSWAAPWIQWLPDCRLP